MSVSTVIRVTRPMRARMALGFNNSGQGLGEQGHLYMVVVSPPCEHTEKVDTQDTQAGGADQGGPACTNG